MQRWSHHGTPTPEELPPVDKLVRGRVYRLCSRNLDLGVFDGELAFIGIRTKFGHRFLDEEYHWTATSHGTVRGAKDSGVDIPAGVEIACYLGNAVGGLWVGRDVNLTNPNYPTEPLGWWRFMNGEVCPADVRVQPVPNTELFEFLAAMEELQDVPGQVSFEVDPDA